MHYSTAHTTVVTRQTHVDTDKSDAGFSLSQSPRGESSYFLYLDVKHHTVSWAVLMHSVCRMGPYEAVLQLLKVNLV